MSDTGQLMTDAEMKAVVDTAHTLHMKVAAHAHGRSAIDSSASLGVDSIEHGAFADAESYRIMKAPGTYLAPTLIAGATVMEYAQKHPDLLKPSVAPTMSLKAYNAYKAGVKRAFGTDAGVYPHGHNAQGFALVVKAGIPPADAIHTALSAAADLIGDAQDIGTIQPGRFADVVATAKDPLADVTELQRIRSVMKGGVVYKQNGQETP